MAVTINLPPDVEQRLRAETPDIDLQAKEAFALELFRRGKLSHYELSEVLGLDRFETDAYLKRHDVFEGSLTMDDLEADRQTLERVLGIANLMLVIADSSPLIVLTAIGHVQILPILFSSVAIPPQVAGELASARRQQVVRDFINNKPAWLNILSPNSNEPIPLLQPAETAAIHLASELHADLLLIDEIQGRKAAAERHLKLTGTIGVLEMAAAAKLLDLRDAFERVKQTDFWISHKLLDARLKQFFKL